MFDKEEIAISNRSHVDQNCVCRKFYYDRRDPYWVFSGAVHRDYCLCLPFDRIRSTRRKKPFFCNTYLTLQIFYNFFIISIKTTNIYFTTMYQGVWQRGNSHFISGSGQPGEKTFFYNTSPCKIVTKCFWTTSKRPEVALIPFTLYVFFCEKNIHSSIIWPDMITEKTRVKW